jgi:hypothetical protein
MSILSNPYVRLKFDEAQTSKSEPPWSSFWNYVLEKIAFSEMKYDVQREDPPKKGSRDKVDIIVSELDPPHSRIRALLFVTVKIAKSGPTLTIQNEDQAERYCKTCLEADNTLRRIWVMTCNGPKFRLWYFDKNGLHTFLTIGRRGELDHYVDAASSAGSDLLQQFWAAVKGGAQDTSIAGPSSSAPLRTLTVSEDKGKGKAKQATPPVEQRSTLAILEDKEMGETRTFTPTTTNEVQLTLHVSRKNETWSWYSWGDTDNGPKNGIEGMDLLTSDLWEKVTAINGDTYWRSHHFKCWSRTRRNIWDDTRLPSKRS